MPYPAYMTVGTIFYSRSAKELLHFEDVQVAIARYERGDWGDAAPRYRARNMNGVEHGGQVVGLYGDRRRRRFWIVTEPGHETTSIKMDGEPWLER